MFFSIGSSIQYIPYVYRQIGLYGIPKADVLVNRENPSEKFTSVQSSCQAGEHEATGEGSKCKKWRQNGTYFRNQEQILILNKFIQS